MMVGLMVLVPLGALALLFAWNGIAVYKYSTGRGGICSLVESFASADDSIRQGVRNNYLAQASSVVRTDADGTQLWNTPDGPWWVPIRSGGAILYDLAEQDRDIYRTRIAVKPGDIVLEDRKSTRLNSSHRL